MHAPALVRQAARAGDPCTDRAPPALPDRKLGVSFPYAVPCQFISACVSWLSADDEMGNKRNGRRRRPTGPGRVRGDEMHGGGGEQ
jgi:hypothetical protein